MYKCPICEQESNESICPICGYPLQTDIQYHKMITALSQEEIHEYQTRITIYKKQYSKLQELQEKNKQNEQRINQLLDMIQLKDKQITMLIQQNNNINQTSHIPSDDDILYERTLKEKDSKTINKVAIQFEQGNGVNKDLKKAFQLYQLASDKGNAYATRNLGLCYDYGKGVPQNYQKAY